MRMVWVGLVIVAAALAASAALAGQKAARTLSNDDIVAMVKAGLGDPVVIAAIEQAGDAQFDTSPASLVALRRAGVPDAVLRAMLVRGAVSTAAAGRPAPPAATTGAVGPGPGIYMSQSESQRPEDAAILEPTVITRVRSRGGWGTALSGGLAKTAIVAEVRGSRATLRTRARSPVFYFRFGGQTEAFNSSPFVGWLASASSPNEFVLIQMYEERDRRELIIGKANAYSSSTGVESENTVPVRIDRLGPGLYKVVPTEPLGVGEFCWFYAAGAGTLQGGVGKLFDFGVDAAGSPR
jgi:hypothetical protein